jgi:hypothetical protein
MVSGMILVLGMLQVGGAEQTGADSAALATAYEDSDARELVRSARERRRLIDRSVDAYRTVAQERISIGLRALRRDRLFFRRETATRIDWTREGPINIEVLAAREVIPPALSKAQVPSDLDGYVPHLAFDPADNRMLIGWGDNNFVRHPLAPGSETHYRFRSGDTTVIALADGRRVRLRELQIVPRRKDVHLIRGSFWLDAESHAVVQAGFRLADDYDLERDDDDADDDDVPGILKPIRAKVQYVTIEYGLWDLKWWLPRIIAFEGSASVGRLLTLPLQYERVYSDYEVTGAATPPPPLTFAEDSLRRTELRERCRSRMNVRVGSGNRERRGRRDQADREAQQPPTDSAEFDPCSRYVVTVPADSAALMTSDLLPPDPYSTGVAMVSEDAIRELTDRLKNAAPAPWQLAAPELKWGLGGAGLVRFNRVEALSIGARAEMDFGRLTATGTARIGVADLEPNAELSVARETFGSRYELTGYRRLAGMDPLTRAFSFSSSFSALVFGRDEEHYYRTLGIELRGRPIDARSQWYDWRLFTQQERRAEKETDFSVRHLLNEDHAFLENAQAARASQYGAALTLRTTHGQNPVGFRWGAELGVEAATGSFDYVRPALMLHTAWPLPGRFVGALEAAGGTTFGDGAEQHLWRLGGSATLRGYPGSVTTGEAFWRGRLELANQLPAARLVLFSDIGRAGELDALRDARPLLSAGAGASLLDGVLRLDLARALVRPTGWRLTLYMDGRL